MKENASGTANGVQEMIMIVDDNPQNLYVLEKLLKENNYNVRPALNGTVALNAMKSIRPDLILLDIRMPEPDGYEVCRRIKAEEGFQDIPVIFISALDAVEDKIRGFKAGGVDYITKPFQKEEVLARVRTHLTLKRAEAVLRRSNAELEKLVRQRTEELEKAKEKAEVANNARTEFLSNVSHEIRTPLNAIIGFSTLLDEMAADENQKNLLKIIMAAGSSLLLMINDILDLARIEAGKMDIHCTPTNLSNVFRQIEQIFAPRAAEKKLDMTFSVSGKIAERILLDEIRMRQCLFNIVGNAVKFTEKGYVRVSADLRPSAHDAQKSDLLIRVEDSGIGIPPESHEKIFEAFQQHDGGITRKFGGAGLGLTIAARMAEMMNGSISLKSEPGQGSTFTLTFCDLPNAKVESESGESAERETVSLENKIVLVADDIEFNRILMKAHLTNCGTQVIEAENGEQAVHLAKEHKPHAIFMDIGMPVMDGYEAVRQLKNDEKLKHIPVIAVSGFASSREKDKALAAGFAGFLAKPYMKEELIRQMKGIFANFSNKFQKVGKE
ncbi:MAG: response regulator [Desulfobacterales bacterium]